MLTEQSTSRNQCNEPIVRFAEKLAEDWPGDIWGDECVPEMYRYACAIFRKGSIETSEAIKLARWFCEISMVDSVPEDVIEQTVERARDDVAADKVKPVFRIDGSGAPEQTPAKRPSIKFQPHDLINASDAAEAAMLDNQAGGDILAHGGCYVTIRRARPATARAMHGDDAKWIIDPIDSLPKLRERLMSSANFFVWSRRAKGDGTWTPAKAPDDLVRTLLDRSGGNALTLTGLLQAPTICPDGRVISHHGYDWETGLYATFSDGEFPVIRSYSTRCENCIDPLDGKPVPAPRDGLEVYRQVRYAKELALAKENAAAAYRWLTDDLLAEFCFREPVDRSAAVAALLTGLVRPVCGQAPAFLFSSPMMSTGKTTLASVIGTAMDGTPPGLHSWPDGDEAELGKTITGILRQGHSVLLFDNVRNGAVIRSDRLAKLLSAEIWQDRILGGNDVVNFPANALVMLTGNNVILEGDMPSRVIEIYLDTQLERPDRRTFQRDIIEWTRTHRGEIVAKALTIIKAYIDAGAPTVAGNATRFPTWDAMVRRAIIWAGGEDVSVKFDRAYEGDPLLAQLRAVIDGWRPALGKDPLAAGDIAAKCAASEFDEKNGQFWQALRSLVDSRRGARLDPRATGTRLKQFVNRPVDGLRIVSSYDSHSKQHKWTVAGESVPVPM